MDIRVGERQSGKTTGLIKQSALTKAIIVAPTLTMARYTKEIATEMNLDIPTPISVYEFIKCKYISCLRDTDRYLIDELQSVLHIMNVDTATVDQFNVCFIKGKDEMNAI